MASSLRMRNGSVKGRIDSCWWRCRCELVVASMANSWWLPWRTRGASVFVSSGGGVEHGGSMRED